ncbi:hypothetical protein QTP86_014983, partial [Hemibagrus guttatus]
MGLHLPQTSQGVYADPMHCDNGHMTKHQQWAHGRVHVSCLPGEHMVPGCTMARRQVSRVSLMIWVVFCWEALGPAIHVNVTLICTTYLSIVADH